MRHTSRSRLLGGLLALLAVQVVHAEEQGPATSPAEPPAPAPPATPQEAVSPNPAAPSAASGPSTVGTNPAAAADPNAAPEAPAGTDAQARAREAYAKARIALREAEKAAGAAVEASQAEASAAIEQHRDEAKKLLLEAHAQAKDALLKAREQLREAGAAVGNVKLTPEVRALVQGALDKMDQDHRADRAERAEKRRGELKKAHGALLDRAEVRAELGRHAWRVARLQRVIEVAEASARPEALTRARTLLAQEQVQHDKALLALAGQMPVAKKPAGRSDAVPTLAPALAPKTSPLPAEKAKVAP